MTIVNIVYLASLGLYAFTGEGGQNLDFIGTDLGTDLKATGAAFANFIITFSTLIQEIITLINYLSHC